MDIDHTINPVPLADYYLLCNYALTIAGG